MRDICFYLPNVFQWLVRAHSEVYYWPVWWSSVSHCSSQMASVTDGAVMWFHHHNMFTDLLFQQAPSPEKSTDSPDGIGEELTPTPRIVPVGTNNLFVWIQNMPQALMPRFFVNTKTYGWFGLWISLKIFAAHHILWFEQHHVQIS